MAGRDSFRDRLIGNPAAGVEELREEVAALRAELREMRAELVSEVRAIEVRQRRDVFFAGEVRSVAETERWVHDNLVGATSYGNPEATIAHACRSVGTDGLAAQFGVGDGKALQQLIKGLRGRKVFGFDTFEGLPEDWRAGIPKGSYAQDGPPDIPGATIVTGDFVKTLPGWLAEHDEPIALLHLAVDLYSTSTTILDIVGDRLRPGTVVVLNDFFNYPGWQDGEYRAWTEYVERTGHTFHYEAYTFNNEQVVVAIDS